MPFQFTPYRSPLTDSIADRIGRGGDIEAQRARSIGNASADAAFQRGNAWAGAIRGIGDVVAGLPAQMAQAKRQGTVDQMNALKLNDAQRDASGRQAMAGMMRGDQLPAGDAGPRQESFLSADGLFDIPKITASLGKSGYGDMAGDLVKGAESINESILKHQATEAQLAKDHAVMIGDLADGALKMMSAGTPLVQAMDFVVQPALATKRLKPEEYDQVKQQIASLPPEQQQRALVGLMDQAARLDKTEAVGEHGRTDRYGRVTGAAPTTPKNETELALAASGGDPSKAMALLKPPSKEPNRTAEQDDARYRDIMAKGSLHQPVSPEDAAWALGYEKQKTLGVDKTASAAADRQAKSIDQQTAQQKRSQDFTQLQAARADIKENVDKPFSVARGGADTLRDVVTAAKGGNKLAGSLQNLEATMAAIKSQGLNRINTAEIGATGNAGSLWDNISGYLGKKAEGQPVPADIQKDMLAFADILDKAAYKKYSDAHDAVNKLYGTTIPKSFQPSATDAGQQDAANKPIKVGGFTVVVK